MANLFTFGCSYTEHRYPTYANWMSTYFDKHYQYGRSGHGNRAIMGELGLVLCKNLIKPDDLVLINWTSLMRDDRIVFNPMHDSYNWNSNGLIDDNDKLLNEQFNPILQGIELISYLNMVVQAIKKYTNNVRMFYMFEPWIGKTLGESGSTPHIEKHYKNINRSGILDLIYKSSQIDEFIYPGIELSRDMNRGYQTWVSYSEGTVVCDYHPSPYEHFQYSRKIIKSLPDSHRYELKSSDLELAKLWDEHISDKDAILKEAYTNFHDIDRNGPRWPNIKKQNLNNSQFDGK